jgi:uncharacterized protein (DUF2342 family)
MNATATSLADTLRTAADEVDQCREAPAAEAKQTFAQAMNRVIRARNAWIASRQGEQQEAMLRRLNALLSLMSSIEFPLGGFHRERIGGVVQELRAMLATVSG